MMIKVEDTNQDSMASLIIYDRSHLCPFADYFDFQQVPHDASLMRQMQTESPSFDCQVLPSFELSLYLTSSYSSTVRWPWPSTCDLGGQYVVSQTYATIKWYACGVPPAMPVVAWIRQRPFSVRIFGAPLDSCFDSSKVKAMAMMKPYCLMSPQVIYLSSVSLTFSACLRRWPVLG